MLVANLGTKNGYYTFSSKGIFVEILSSVNPAIYIWQTQRGKRLVFVLAVLPKSTSDVLKIAGLTEFKISTNIPENLLEKVN